MVVANSSSFIQKHYQTQEIISQKFIHFLILHCLILNTIKSTNLAIGSVSKYIYMGETV